MALEKINTYSSVKASANEETFQDVGKGKGFLSKALASQNIVPAGTDKWHCTEF